MLHQATHGAGKAAPATIIQRSASAKNSFCCGQIGESVGGERNGRKEGIEEDGQTIRERNNEP